MFNRIIVAIDLEHDTAPDRLLQAAGDIARLYNADMHLLHVIRAAPAIVSQYLESGYENLASAKVEERLESPGRGPGRSAPAKSPARCGSARSTRKSWRSPTRFRRT